MVESAFEWLTAVSKHADHDQKDHGRRGIVQHGRFTLQRDADNGISARTEEGRLAGYLTWNATTEEFGAVNVMPEHQRQGLATAMLAMARRDFPNLTLTEDDAQVSSAGKAWSSTVGLDRMSKHGTKGTPNYPHPAKGTASIAWRPSMTRQEAEEWAKNSAIKAPLTFIGKRRSTAKIKEEGFQNIEILSAEEAKARLGQQQVDWDAWSKRMFAERRKMDEMMTPEYEDIYSRLDSGEIDQITADQMESDLDKQSRELMDQWAADNPEPQVASWRGKVRAGRVWGDGIYLGMADVKAVEIWGGEYGSQRAAWITRREEELAEAFREADAARAAMPMVQLGATDEEYLAHRAAEQAIQEQEAAAVREWEAANPPPVQPTEFVDPSIRMYGPMKTVYPNLDTHRDWVKNWRAVNRNYKAGIIDADQFRQWEMDNPEPESGPTHGQALLVKINVTNPAVINVPDNDPTYNSPEEHIAEQIPGFGDLLFNHTMAGLQREQAMSRALIDLGYDALVITQYAPGEEDQGQGFDQGAGGPQVVLFDKTKAVVVSDESPRYMDEIYKHGQKGEPGYPHKPKAPKAPEVPNIPIEPTAFNAALERIRADHPEIRPTRLHSTATRLLNGGEAHTLNAFTNEGVRTWENQVRRELGLSQRTRPLPPSMVAPSRTMPPPPPEAPHTFRNPSGDTATINPDRSISEVYSRGGTAYTPADAAASRIAALEDPNSAWVEVGMEPDFEQKLLPMKGLPTPPPPAPPVAPNLNGSSIEAWMTNPQDKIPHLLDRERDLEMEISDMEDTMSEWGPGDHDPAFEQDLRDKHVALAGIRDEMSDLEYAEPELKPEVEAALRNTYAVNVGGLRSEVTSIVSDQYEIRVGGKVYDEASGDQAGTFTRVFTDADYDSGIQVTHDYFMIESRFRAQKFGDAFFAKSIETYNDSGSITKVKVHANIDVGGYVWAKRGFEWDTDEGYGGIPAKATRSLAKAVIGADALDPEVKIYKESGSYGETMVVRSDDTGYIIDSTYGDPTITRWFDEPYEVLEHLDGVTLDEDYTVHVAGDGSGTMLAVNEDNASAYFIKDGTAQYLDYGAGVHETVLANEDMKWSLAAPTDIPEWVPNDSWSEMDQEDREDLHPARPMHEFTVDQAREWIRADVMQDYDDMPTPMDLANWGADRPENRWDHPIYTPSGKPAKSVPMWPGKEMMLGTDWYGVIELSGGW